MYLEGFGEVDYISGAPPKIHEKRDKGHYVYKYVEDGAIIYVGQNNTWVTDRIYQHSLEAKFKEHQNADIYYASLASKAEADIMERPLISKYKPILNVTYKDDDLNISFTEPEWILHKPEKYDAAVVKAGYSVRSWETKKKKYCGYMFFKCSICGAYTSASYGISYEIAAPGQRHRWMAQKVSACEKCYNEFVEPIAKQLEQLERIEIPIREIYRKQTEALNVKEKELAEKFFGNPHNQIL